MLFLYVLFYPFHPGHRIKEALTCLLEEESLHLKFLLGRCQLKALRWSVCGVKLCWVILDECVMCDTEIWHAVH